MIRLICLFVVVIAAGCSDYEDAKEQERIYCEMVGAGNWAAYNKSIDCGAVK